MNEAFRVNDRQLCEPCADEDVKQHGESQQTGLSVARLIDSTVCAQCAADNGREALPTIAQAPVCPTCEEFLRNRPYPTWLKLSFVVLLALTATCLFRNWRFFVGYREMQGFYQALQRLEWDTALTHGTAAAAQIPEVKELGGMASFARGMKLLEEDQSAEAVQALNAARSSGCVPEPVVARLIAQAELGAAFDAKDYDTFLKLAQAYAAASPGDEMALASLASAYACKYAETGAEEYRNQSRQKLDEAARLAGADTERLRDYRNRIDYRLDTREIISRKEFARRFPNGYQAGSKP